MKRSATHDRHGSHAGRGFRYQDAIAAMLALRVWAGLDPPAIIIPEGNDDVERRSAAGNALVQIKSRREDLNGLPLASARNYIVELWERHDKFTPPAARLELILEQGIVDHAATADGAIVPSAKLTSQLPHNTRSRALLAKTDIRQVPSPNANSIAIIADRMNCSPLAAALCVAQLLHEVGMLANDNGRLKAIDYRGLSASDTSRIVADTLAATDVEAIETALRNGACEPTGFLTPLDDPEFYLGVDVQPGHVAAGLVIPRLQPREALARGLETRGAALVAGPSGAGKSAIMWDAAHSLRHTIRWYRLLRVDLRDVPALRQLVRALRANPDSPVGFVVDDIGRRGAEGWDALILEFAAVPGVVLLGSIREEDLFLLQGRSRAAEVRAEPDKDLARRIYEELRRNGLTAWSGWQEPWARSQGLVLEYVHILTAGQRFEETLAGQVDARQRDPARAVELSVLRVVALIGAAGAAASADQLPAVLSLPEEDIGRGLRRLVDEHLLRVDADGALTGLHQLRSAELARLAHAFPPPTIATTFSRAAGAVSARDLEPLVADSVRNRGVSQDAAIAALGARIQADPKLEALSAGLRGLGTARIATAVDTWLATAGVKALPTTQVGTAAIFGLAGITVPGTIDKRVMTAATELAKIRADTGVDPRHTLLEALPASLLTEMVSGTSDSAALDLFLSSLNGMPLHPTVRSALATRPIDLLTAPLDGVARLLGTLAVLDRDEAIAWVDEVGEKVLVDRIPHEVAWASAPIFEDATDGRVIRCDYNEIGIPGEDGTHDRVVRICEVAMALSPRSDIAASAARAPNGEVVGFAGLSLAEKRIPRANLPAATLPEWNRRWRDAIAIRVASPTYSGYLAKAVQLLDRLAPSLERVLNLIIRGKVVTDAPLAAMNGVHDAARELTPPAIAPSVATGEGAGQFNATATKLESLLDAGSADVHSRFEKLPQGAGAFLAWTADLIRDVNEIEKQEPWELVGGIPASLGKMRELLVRVRLVAGDTASGSVHPSVKFAMLAGKARPDNALRFAASVVETKMKTARSELATSIRSTLKDQGIEAEVRVEENPDGILPWPPSTVLVVVPLTSHMEIESHANAVAAARQAVPEGIRLTVIPEVDGTLLPGRGVSGYQTLLPLPEEANAWIERLRLPSFHAQISPILSLAIGKASALQSMDRVNLGVAGRPVLELEARHRLEDELASTRNLLTARLDELDPEGTTLALSLLDRVRSGEANFADATQEFTASQTPNETIQEVFGFQVALDDAEFRRGRARTGIDGLDGGRPVEFRHVDLALSC